MKRKRNPVKHKKVDLPMVNLTNCSKFDARVKNYLGLENSDEVVRRVTKILRDDNLNVFEKYIAVEQVYLELQPKMWALAGLLCDQEGALQ